MIKKKIEKGGPIEIDLTGPDGNVFVLMKYAMNLSSKLYDFMTEELEEAQQIDQALKDLYDGEFSTPKTMGEFIVAKMMESDYEHAVQTFDKYFGNVVILYR